MTLSSQTIFFNTLRAEVMPKPGCSKFRSTFWVFCSETENLEQNSKFWSHLELWAYGDYKTFKNWHSLKFSYKLGGPTLEICNFFPTGHFRFLGGQLKWVNLYVLRAAFCNLAMFSPPAHFLWHIFPFRNFPINSFSLPWHISFAGLQEKLQSGWMQVKKENIGQLKSD